VFGDFGVLGEEIDQLRTTTMQFATREIAPRAAQADRTRQQILETAQRLFTELGYDATSLQMIADELGLTKAAVYYHFRAKSDILHAAMLPGIRRLEALLDEAAASFAASVRGSEGREGTAAFVEKRKPSWVTQVE